METKEIKKAWKERQEFDKENSYQKHHNWVRFDTYNTSDSPETWGLI